jgi:hypothetical protein
MEDTKEFIKAYHDFRESIDFSKSGILPELDDLTCYMLMGVPPVPADNDPSEEAPIEAIDQRVSILKAVFVELNRDQSDDFINQGLSRYDEAGRMAKILLEEGNSTSDT